jgi:hypothetical protein
MLGVSYSTRAGGVGSSPVKVRRSSRSQKSSISFAGARWSNVSLLIVQLWRTRCTRVRARKTSPLRTVDQLLAD